MKKLALCLLLLAGTYASAIPYGEWKESDYHRFLYISNDSFVFRECGRYRIVTEGQGVVDLLTGRDVQNTECLPRGVNRCSYSISGKTLTLDCMLWKRTYVRG